MKTVTNLFLFISLIILVSSRGFSQSFLSEEKVLNLNLSQCSSIGDACGNPQEGKSLCCSGLRCKVKSNSGLGAGGVCISPNDLLLSESNIELSQCASIGDDCGNPQEGKQLCCSPLRCRVKSNSGLGAGGICISPNDLFFMENTVDLAQCASIGDDCGNPQEGKSLCCSPLRCKVKSNSGLGAGGHCISPNDL